MNHVVLQRASTANIYQQHLQQTDYELSTHANDPRGPPQPTQLPDRGRGEGWLFVRSAYGGYHTGCHDGAPIGVQLAANETETNTPCR